MRINCGIAIVILALGAVPAFAAGPHGGTHGDEIFHRFTLEMDVGDSRADTVGTWDLDGWIGNDENKLWLKSEGEVVEGTTENAEFWAMYSRNISEFWDAQLGLRQDTEPVTTSYLVAGFDGMAPYYIETEAHVFLSDEGDLSFRLRQENDLLLTQQLILRPRVEFNLSAQNVPEQDIGAGLVDGEFSLQMRYEVTRQFAPYIDLRYDVKLGETANIARDQNEHTDALIASLGLRLVF
jgi:copper resistance protein B